MEKETFYLVCFESTQKALYTERQLRRKVSAVRLVPIPSEIRAGCGLGLKIALEYVETLKEDIQGEDVYLVAREGSRRDVQKTELGSSV